MPQASAFLAQVKRAGIPRIALLYGATTVGVVIVARLVVPFIGLPPATPIYLVGLAVFAFPVVLALVWINHSNLEERAAEAREGIATPSPAPGPSPYGSGIPPAHSRASTEPVAESRSIAVLPLQNASGTEEVAALASGFHEELLASLARIPGLSVISRQSVGFYRDTVKPTADVAAELDVDTVLEGSFQAAEGQVRVGVQLLDAESDVYRWAERYDRVLSPETLAEIAAELARRIVTSMRPTQESDRGAGRVTGSRARTASLEAYRSWSIGRRWLGDRTGDGLLRALGAFEEAARLDPGFSLAWSGQAEALGLLRWNHHPVPGSAPDAMQAAHRALELDSGLAQAHTALALLHLLSQEAPFAREAVDRAMHACPGMADVHMWDAWLNLFAGTPEASLDPARLALRLNSRAPMVHVVLAEALLATGQSREARLHARKAVELDPGLPLAHYLDGLVAYHLNELDEAREALERALPLVPPWGGVPRVSGVRAALGLVHVASGNRVEAAGELRALGQEAGARRNNIGGDPADLFSIGLFHLSMGDTDLALDLFRQVEHWGRLVTEEVRYFYPEVLGPLRQDERFQAVLAAVDRSWNVTAE
jgi:TolB-like protein/Flp pilus assembly protein TadD